MMPVDTANDVFLEHYSGADESSENENESESALPLPPKQWHLDAEALEKLPWVFAKTTGSAYEDGLPHTRAPNIIFLSARTLASRDKALAKTLLHEKIHVYQRAYPDKAATAIAGAGYAKTGRLRRDVPLIRANPDLDEWIYADPSGRDMALVYSREAPHSIGDVTGGSGEHPYEVMAYEWEL